MIQFPRCALCTALAFILTRAVADDAALGQTAQSPTTAEKAVPTGQSAAETVSNEGVAEADPHAAAAAPREFRMPSEHHPWARFEPGAWRELKVTTEAFSPDGKAISKSTAVQTEVLRTVAPGQYSVDLHAKVEISGKEIAGDWRNRVLDPALDRTVDNIEYTFFEDASISVEEVAIPCSVWELRYQSDGHQIVDRLYYSSEVSPHVLRRERIELADDPQDEPRSIETTEVEAVSLPYHWEDQRLDCSCLRKVRVSAKGRSVSVVLTSASAPGGDVAIWTTEWDADGNRVRTIVTELADFGMEVVEVDRRWLPRRPLRQLRRQNR